MAISLPANLARTQVHPLQLRRLRVRVQASARAKGVGNSSTPKRRRQKKPQEPDGAIVLGISDLVLGKPPWYVFKDAPVKDMGLNVFAPSLVISDEEEQEVKVSLQVEPVGRGYYLRGEARADVSLECADCSAQCICQVESVLEAWLSREEYSSEDEVGPCEIPWSPQLRSVDLTSLVAAAVGEALPIEIRCEGGCNIKAGETEKALTEASSPKRQSKSAFGELAKLKSNLPINSSE